MVEPQRVRRCVRSRLGERHTTGRGEVLSLLVAEVSLGRRQVRPVGLSLDAIGSDGDQSVADALGPGVAQQPLNHPLALFVATLAELVMPDSSVGVGDVYGGPVVVAERAPHPVVAVDRDRIPDPHVPHGFADVVDVLLERELGCVHADGDEPAIVVLRGPRANVRERAKPIDARVRPEIDEHDLSPEVGRREGRRVEPPGRPVETREVTLRGHRSRSSVAEHVAPAHASPALASASPGSRRRQLWTALVSSWLPAHGALGRRLGSPR